MLDHESSQLTNAPIRGAVQSAPPTQKRFCQDGFDLTNAWLLANRPFHSTDIARLEWYEEVKADAAAVLRSHNLTSSQSLDFGLSELHCLQPCYYRIDQVF